MTGPEKDPPGQDVTAPSPQEEASPPPEPDSRRHGEVYRTSLEKIEEFQQVITHISQGGNPLLDKLDGDHIHKVLAQAESVDKRRHEQAKWRIQLTGVLALFGSGVIFALSWLFLAYGKSEILAPIITLIIGFLGGLAGGYGLGKANRNE